MKPEKKSGPFRMWAMASLLLLFLLLVVGVLFILGRELIVRLDARIAEASNLSRRDFH